MAQLKRKAKGRPVSVNALVLKIYYDRLGCAILASVKAPGVRRSQNSQNLSGRSIALISLKTTHL